jgi:hypothetical protein
VVWHAGIWNDLLWIFLLNRVGVIRADEFFCVIYFYAHTGKWQNNQQFDGGHSAVEVEVCLVWFMVFKRPFNNSSVISG